jgi:hypothetical protein
MAEWSGDGRYFLPARQVEPYRLWFEFLKLADTDPELTVDPVHYADWGDYGTQSFTNWWSGETWRRLFAVDAAVRVLDVGELVVADETAIVVRLPLGRDRKETLRDIMDLLDQHGADHRLASSPNGKFALTEGYEKGFLKYLPQARLMLRLYRIWLSHQDLEGKGRIGKTAVDFITWARTRDGMIKSKGYKYERPLIPYSIGQFADDVIAGQYPDDNHRRAFLRYLKKAQSLAGNAAAGTFPGKW